ncbi:thioredoxin-like domain-containing protein [Ferruginibacter sp.]|nr:AhpC/TSA family protein [Ferruginibacter sp.]
MNIKLSKILYNIVWLNMIFVLTSCKPQPQNIITIKGSVKNLAAKKVYLASAFQWNKFIDSADCINGQFTINYKIDSSFEPFIACIEFRDSVGKLKTLHYINPFLSTPEKKYSGNGFMLEKGTIDISGSLTPKEELSLKAGKETDVINKTQLLEFGYINTTDSTKRIWLVNKYKSIIKENPFSLFLLNGILTNKDQYSKEEVKDYLTLFTSDVQNSRLANKLKTYLAIRPDPGLPLTNLLLLNSKGEKDRIINNSSKLNLLIFWASWCGPCRMEIPQLKSLYKKLSGRGLSMASISTDRDTDKWKKAIKEENMPWAQFILDSTEYEKGEALYNFTSIPVTILTDNQGNEILRTIGFEKENKLILFIEQYFKKNH